MKIPKTSMENPLSLTVERGSHKLRLWSPALHSGCPSPSLKRMEFPPWMTIAAAEIGVCTFPPEKCNPRIVEYHEHTNIRGYDDKASWCSSFVNWSLAQVGISGTNSALARSWLEWGKALDQPEPGCIAVLSREDPSSWKGHVGFFLRFEEDRIYLLGGNQLEKVQEHYYPRATVLGYRWPTEGTL